VYGLALQARRDELNRRYSANGSNSAAVRMRYYQAVQDATTENRRAELKCLQALSQLAPRNLEYTQYQVDCLVGLQEYRQAAQVCWRASTRLPAGSERDRWRALADQYRQRADNARRRG